MFPRIQLAFLLLCVSCSAEKTEDGDKSNASSPKEVSTRTETSKEDLDSANGTLLTSLPSVDGVLPLTKANMSVPRSAAAVSLNAQGLKAHRAKEFAPAIEYYKRSLSIDPGAVLPRYNLACALVLSGEEAQGLALLDQFREVACSECRERLRRSRVDKDWQGLWLDPVFLRIVAPLLEEDSVGVGFFDARLPFSSEKASFTLSPRMVLDRLPRTTTLPEFTLVLSDAKKELARAPMVRTKPQGEQLVGRIRVPGIGRYLLSLVVEDRVYRSEVFVVRQMLNCDPETYSVTKEVLELWEGDDENGFGENSLQWWHFPLPADNDYCFLQIWQKNGKVVDLSSLEIDGVKLGEDSCSYPQQMSFDVTPAPGSWRLGLYSNGGPSFEIAYKLKRKGALETPPSLTTLARAPAWTKKHFEAEGLKDCSRAPVWNGKGQASSTRMVRATTRSLETLQRVKKYMDDPSPKNSEALLDLAAKHGGPWKASELPHSITHPAAKRLHTPEQPLKGYCTSSRCSAYPAISADEITLVTYEPEEIEFWDEEEECYRPEGRFYRFWNVATGKEVPSQDLTDFRPMSCTNSASHHLEAGHQLTLQGKEFHWTLTIRNKSGKTVKKKKDSSVALDYCTLPGVRMVVVRGNNGSTDCHDVEQKTLEAVLF